MDTRSAQKAFIALNVIVAPAVMFSVYDAIRVTLEVAHGYSPITVHSGTQYLLLGTVIWVLYAVQRIGLSGNKKTVQKWGGTLIVGWFIAMLLLANIIPHSLRAYARAEGYNECVNAENSSGHGRGRQYTYTQKPCADVESMNSAARTNY